MNYTYRLLHVICRATLKYFKIAIVCSHVVFHYNVLLYENGIHRKYTKLFNIYKIQLPPLRRRSYILKHSPNQDKKKLCLTTSKLVLLTNTTRIRFLCHIVFNKKKKKKTRERHRREM